jgi:hypothetical protein
MVIDDFDIMRLLVPPSKTQAPLQRNEAIICRHRIASQYGS